MRLLLLLVTGRLGRLWLLLSSVLLVSLCFNPALRGDCFLGAVGGRAKKGFDVIVVDHFFLQQGICQLERKSWQTRSVPQKQLRHFPQAPKMEWGHGALQMSPQGLKARVPDNGKELAPAGPLKMQSSGKGLSPCPHFQSWV